MVVFRSWSGTPSRPERALMVVLVVCMCALLSFLFFLFFLFHFHCHFIFVFFSFCLFFIFRFIRLVQLQLFFFSFLFWLVFSCRTRGRTMEKRVAGALLPASDALVRRRAQTRRRNPPQASLRCQTEYGRRAQPRLSDPRGGAPSRHKAKQETERERAKPLQKKTKKNSGRFGSCDTRRRPIACLPFSPLCGPPGSLRKTDYVFYFILFFCST